MATPPLEARHRPSGLNSAFNGNPSLRGGQLSFADYVARNREMLRRAHAGAVDLDRIIDGNAPFELKPDNPSPPHSITSDLAGVVCQFSRMASSSIREKAGEGVETPLPGAAKPYRRGVLLAHGLSDSPYTMRHLAEFFRQNGFRVMAILLPGHGTRPGDLLEVTWQEWAKTVAYGAYKLAEEVEEVYLAGYSTGAALSVYHGLRDSRVRGLFLFSPALKITPKAAFARLHKLYSWLWPAAKWVDINPDLDIYKYESFTMNAAAQTHALTRVLARLLHKQGMGIPVFIAASADDMTVNTEVILDFVARARHPASRLLLYTTEPERMPPGIPAERLERVDSVVPEQKILSSAHTAILMPPEDVHYGADGEYSNCVHYYPDDSESYAACLKQPSQDFQGEITAKNLATGILRRLTYNPNFAGLKTSMQRFIAGLP